MVGVYEIATGRLVSVGSVLPEELPVELATLALPEGAIAFSTHDWQAVPPAWVVKPPAFSYVMSRGDWMGRLGFTRETALNMLRLSPSGDLQTRATLATLESALLRRADVDVRHVETQAGAAILGDVLVALGQVAPEDKAAFVKMMLAPVAL